MFFFPGTEATSDFNIESCPKDSTFVFDTCKCDHSLCQKPQCLTSLVILSNATDTPGSCCSTYSCEGCQEEDKINGQCPCAHNAILDSAKGECKCVNPHETLKNITCECDPSKCKLPDLCADGVPVRQFDGCCETVTCLACPSDSYPTKFPDFEIENNCVCYPCNTKCEPHQQIKIIHKGRNLPGHCCDIYECTKGCISNGTFYDEGETVDSCKCLNGILMCSHVDDDSDFSTCLEEKNVYHHLQTWMRDACTNCTCINGETKCIAHMCNVVTKEVKMISHECPPVGYCKRSCKNGYKLDKMGCETCKCKAPTDKVYVKSDQYLQLDALFKEYNLTESDAVALLKSALSDKSDRTVKSSTTKAALVVPSTSYCITSGQNSYGKYGFPVLNLRIS